MSDLISVIVCHHQGDLIYKAIASLKESREVSFEIIVVSSIPNISLPGCTIVHLYGEPAAKRNLGMKYARGNKLAFFDDDVEVKPDCLAELARVLDYPDCGMVFGKTLNMEFRTRFDEAGSYLTSIGFLYARAESGIEDKGQFDAVEPILSGKSASCMIHRKVFADIGMFDSWFGILGEETDLAWRVWLYGYKVLYVPSSVAYHAFNTRFKPQTFYNHKRVYYNGCRNYIALLISNLEGKNLAYILPIHILAWLVAAIGMALSGKLEAAKHILLGLAAVFQYRGHILIHRRYAQLLRVKSDHDLFPYILRSPGLRYYLIRMLRYFKVGLHG